MQGGRRTAVQFNGRYELTAQRHRSTARPWTSPPSGIGSGPSAQVTYARVEGMIDCPAQAVVKTAQVKVTDAGGAVRALQTLKLGQPFCRAGHFEPIKLFVWAVHEGAGNQDSSEESDHVVQPQEATRHPQPDRRGHARPGRTAFRRRPARRRRGGGRRHRHRPVQPAGLQRTRPGAGQGDGRARDHQRPGAGPCRGHRPARAAAQGAHRRRRPLRSP